MHTVDRICDWLANHEMVACALLVAMVFCAGLGFCRWMKYGIIPDEDDGHDEHESNSVG